jgi:hypothetical protein
MSSDLTDAQRALADRMSEISEEAFFAQWMLNLEFDLWRIVVDGHGRYGYCDLEPRDLHELRALSAACGGWIVFDDELGETFVPMEEWRRRFEEHRLR